MIWVVLACVANPAQRPCRPVPATIAYETAQACEADAQEIRIALERTYAAPVAVRCGRMIEDLR